MSKEIDWSKAPEGYPIWIEDLKPGICGDMGGWHREESDRYVDDKGEFWSKPEDGFYRVYRNPNESWTGQGLPPVGTVCEFYDYSSSVDWRDGLENGDKVKILAHYSPLGDGDLVAVFCYEIEGGKLTDQAVADCFRPIRTPEQIAAEEREKAILAMFKDAGCWDSRFESWELNRIFGFLHDSGYRKTEAGK